MRASQLRKGASEIGTGSARASKGRDIDEERCRSRAGRVRTSSLMISLLHQMKKIRMCSPLWAVMVRDGCRHKFGRAQRFALLERDTQQTLRAASLRRSPCVRDVPYPGSQEYFHLPHPFKGRRKQTGLKTLARTCSDSGGGWASRYFIGYRNRTLRVAAENLRYASAQEAMGAEPVAKKVGSASRDCFDES